METKIDGKGASGKDENNPSRQSSVSASNSKARTGIFGWVNGLGKAVNYGSLQIRRLQSGQTDSYFLLMVLGMVLLFTLWTFF